jgi:hypothetical protein
MPFASYLPTQIISELKYYSYSMAKLFIRRMPKTLEGVSDSGGHTCATAAG